jgi:hypothetical protein
MLLQKIIAVLTMSRHEFIRCPIIPRKRTGAAAGTAGKIACDVACPSMWVLRQCARILGVGVRRVLNTTRRDLLILAMSCRAITLKIPNTAARHRIDIPRPWLINSWAST